MANTHQLVKAVMDGAKMHLANSPRLNAESVDALFGGTSISHESAEYANLTSTAKSYQDAVASIIRSLQIGNEAVDYSAKLSKAQINAGKFVAAFASNPKAAIAQYTKPRSVAQDDFNIVVDSANVEGYLSGESAYNMIAQEAFDGQNLNNAIYFSIAYNVGAATQDEFGETIYPTIAVSPTEAGISVSIEYVAIMKEFMRNVNGTVVHQVQDRVSILKKMYDSKTFGSDATALIPVWRENGVYQNTDKFVAGSKYVEDKIAPEAVTTGALKFGEDIDILGISQTDDILAKGVMDNTDAVDRSVALSKVFIEVNNKAGNKKELISYDVSAASSKRFYPAIVGQWKKLVCSFDLKGASLNTANTKTVEGQASGALGEIAGNYNIMFEISINGSLNVDDGSIKLTSAPLKFLGVRDENGKLIASTEQTYTDAKTLIETKASLVGYVVDAKRTNTNVRTRGVVVSNEVYNYIYNAPFRSGITCLKPLVNYAGTDNDANRIAAQAQATGFIISNMAVNTLVDHFNALRAAAQNGGLESMAFEGVGEKFIYPYYREEAIDLADVVDSLESSKRDQDIQANLIQRINNIAIDMIIKSNYGPAFQVLKGNSGQKITIVVATDPNLARLIVKDGVSEFEYGERFKFKIVSTFNELVRGQIFILPTVLDENKNTTPDPLNYGFCIYTPTIVYEVSKTTNGAVAGELNTIPRFLHVNNLPLGGFIKVSDVSAVFNKLELHTAPKARA